MPTIVARRPYTAGSLGAAYNRKEIRDQLNLLAQSISPMVTRTVTFNSPASALMATNQDDTILCDATDGAFAFLLPVAAQAQFLKVSIKKIDASGHAVTLTASGSDTIDGAATVSLGTQYKSRTVQSNGSLWYVLASV